MIITGTYNLIADPSWSLLQLQEVYLECDTTLNPVIINLFPISDLKGFKNIKLYISDVSNNATVNNITINAGSSGVPIVFDKINNTLTTSFTINKNGGVAIFAIATETTWCGLSEVVIPTIQAYNTIEDEGNPLPQKNTINFVGNGVQAYDLGGKTIVFVSGVSVGNFGLFSQIQSSVPITATVSELSLIGVGVGSLSVPINGFTIGDSFQVIMTGHLSCANNQTLRIKIKTNGIVLADTGLIQLKTSTNKHFELEIYFTIRKIGISGIAEIVSGGTFMTIQNASTNLEGYNFSTETSTGFDTTVINTLEITAQWGSNNAANSIYSDILTLNKIY